MLWLCLALLSSQDRHFINVPGNPDLHLVKTGKCCSWGKFKLSYLSVSPLDLKSSQQAKYQVTWLHFSTPLLEPLLLSSSFILPSSPFSLPIVKSNKLTQQTQRLGPGRQCPGHSAMITGPLFIPRKPSCHLVCWILCWALRPLYEPEGWLALTHTLAKVHWTLGMEGQLKIRGLSVGSHSVTYSLKWIHVHPGWPLVSERRFSVRKASSPFSCISPMSSSNILYASPTLSLPDGIQTGKAHHAPMDLSHYGVVQL